MTTDTTSTSKDKAADAMAAVVAQLVDAIEAGGTDGWSMPWERFGADALCPSNAVTGNGYRGGNRFVLAFSSMLFGYTSGTWATYRQWASVGGQVRKGETSTRIVRPVELRPAGDRDGSADVAGDASASAGSDGTGTDEQRPRIVWRTVAVFNSDQQDGWAAPEVPTDDRDPIEAAEELLTGWQAAGMRFAEGGNRAYYSPRTDDVHVPARGQFGALEHFYSTSFHEATHWTGPRLNRPMGERGTDAYAAEELVAELGAAMIGAHVGIAQASRDDHAAYLAGWLRNLRANPRHLWTAAGAAEKAAGYLLGLAGQPTA